MDSTLQLQLVRDIVDHENAGIRVNRTGAGTDMSLPKTQSIQVSWLGLFLIISIATLFFQLFPGVWWGVVGCGALVLSYLDVRTWTWRSYAVVSGIAIAILLVAKGRESR